MTAAYGEGTTSGRMIRVRMVSRRTVHPRGLFDFVWDLIHRSGNNETATGIARLYWRVRPMLLISPSHEIAYIGAITGASGIWVANNRSSESPAVKRNREIAYPARSRWRNLTQWFQQRLPCCFPATAARASERILSGKRSTWGHRRPVPEFTVGAHSRIYEPIQGRPAALQS